MTTLHPSRHSTGRPACRARTRAPAPCPARLLGPATRRHNRQCREKELPATEARRQPRTARHSAACCCGPHPLRGRAHGGGRSGNDGGGGRQARTCSGSGNRRRFENGPAVAAPKTFCGSGCRSSKGGAARAGDGELRRASRTAPQRRPGCCCGRRQRCAPASLPSEGWLPRHCAPGQAPGRAAGCTRTKKSDGGRFVGSLRPHTRDNCAGGEAAHGGRRPRSASTRAPRRGDVPCPQRPCCARGGGRRAPRRDSATPARGPPAQDHILRAGPLPCAR